MPSEAVWRRVYDDIRRQIETGELEPGDQLPSTPNMVQQFAHLSPRGQISMTTVRKAIMILQAEGWLTGYPGLGVYVSDKLPQT